MGTMLLCPSRGRSREEEEFWLERESVIQSVLKESEGGFSKHREFIKALTCKQGISI